MGPKKDKVSESGKGRKKTIMTIEMKKELIAKFESGARVVELSRMYGKSPSTICSILKNKDTIKSANVAKGVTVLSKQRSSVIDEVEKLLLIWISEKQLAGDSVSEAIICEKARQIYEDLLKKTPGTISSESELFKASRGWFENFKKRSGIHSVVRHGEAASADKDGAEKFVQEFQEYVEAEGYIPQQVFNCDETGLFWKKMPNRTYITQEEKALPGHKPMKDRITLLLGANASGDLKFKPLLVYHSETPRVFKKHNVLKNKLPVMWRSNSKAWITRHIFVEWINDEVGPSIKKYLTEKKLPLRALIIMDNATSHPHNLKELILEEYQFIDVMFFPPNTTSILQPMDQQVISNFKKLYTKFLFKRCFDVTSDTQLTLREFWKEHFNILNSISLIDKAWQEVSLRTLNSSWRKLQPAWVPERDFEGFETEGKGEQVVEEIVSLGKSLGLEVNGRDIEELVEEHGTDLTTEKLEAMMNDQNEMAIDVATEEEERKEISSAEIKKTLAMWGQVQKFVEENHPDVLVTTRTVDIFNEKVITHFKQVLKRRQKQVSLDRFLVKVGENKDGPSTKRQKTDEQQTETIPVHVSVEEINTVSSSSSTSSN